MLDESVVIESRKEHSSQKLYSYARLITEKEQVAALVAQFDKEFDILSQLCNLEAGTSGVNPRMHVLQKGRTLLESINLETPEQIVTGST